MIQIGYVLAGLIALAILFLGARFLAGPCHRISRLWHRQFTAAVDRTLPRGCL